MSSISEGSARSGIQSYETARGRRWRVRYELPAGADGERRQSSKRGFTSKKDAKRFLRNVLADLEPGSYLAPEKLTVREWFEDEWLPSRRPNTATARGHRGTVGLSTWEQYRTYVRAYVVPYLGEIALQQLAPADLDRLYDRLEAQGKRRGRCATAGVTCREHDCSPALHDGIAPKTLANLHGLVHKALVDAVKRGRVKRNVADLVEAPGSERPTHRWWSPDELRAFVTHVRGDRLYAAWLLFVTTGMRRGEVAGLAWDDIDLETGVLTVNWQLGVLDSKPTFKPRPKSKAGARTMSLDPATVEALRVHRRHQLEERIAAGPIWQDEQPDHLGTSRTGLVFTWEDGSLIHPERLSTWFRRHCSEAGLPAIRLHDVRHSYASAGLANATGWHEVKIISERLGHANVAITIDTYSHVLPAADAATAHTLAKLILGGP
jgi:integrase